jgi:hypothetical protein
MVSTDAAKRIRAIFLHDGRAVTIDRAARLLGWSPAAMLAAIKAGGIDVKVSRSGLSITRAELLYRAAEQWPFSVIERALGTHAASRLPAGLRMHALPVPVHQYAADALHYLATKRGQSVETLLARILDDYTIQHITELVTNVPSYRDSLPNLTEAAIARAYAAVRRHRRP